MKKRKLVFAITAITVFSAMMLTSNTKAQAAAKKTYTITPKLSPYKGKYKKAKGYYNSTTKQYFAIRSYLELLEKKGGGKLVIKKGTYKIPNVLYIPSNVTIELNDGVTIKKIMKTKAKKMKPGGGIFELLEPSKAKKKGVHGRYNGVHDVMTHNKCNTILTSFSLIILIDHCLSC